MSDRYMQRRPYPGDIYQEMNIQNQQYYTQKEYNQNFHDYALHRETGEARRHLDCYHPVSLKSSPINHSMHKIFLNEKLLRIIAPIARGTEFNPIGIVVQVLTAIISAIWGRCNVHVKDNWYEAAVLMTLQVAEPSTRKSPIVSLVRKPFEEFFAKKQKESTERKIERSIQEDMIKGLTRKKEIEIVSIIKKNQNGEIDHDEMKAEMEEVSSFCQREIYSYEQQLLPPFTCSGLIDATTTYQLGKSLSGQGESGCSISAEGGLFASSFIQKGNFGKLFNRLHDQEAYEALSGRGNISLKNPTLSIVNFAQPCVAREFYSNKEANETGATARFLPFFHGSQKDDYSIEIISESCCELSSDDLEVVDTPSRPYSSFELETYDEIITRLLELYFTQDADAEKFCVKLTPEAQQEIDNFYRYIQDDVSPYMSLHVKPALGKLHGKAVRFALAIHAIINRIPHEKAIDVETIKIACSICEYLIPHIEYACVPEGAQAYSDAVAIIDNLLQINTHSGSRKILNEGIDKATLSNRVNIKGERLDNALIQLTKHNIVAIVDNGRSSYHVVLHPDFFYRKMY